MITEIENYRYLYVDTGYCMPTIQVIEHFTLVEALEIILILKKYII